MAAEDSNSGAEPRLAHDNQIDLDVLRGWNEEIEPGLQAPHALPALARLVCDDGGRIRGVYAIHGPEAYVGRYHPQHGPVDLVLTDLEDFEVYKLSAPHIRLEMERSGRWFLRPMSPAANTEINGARLHDTRKRYAIEDGDVVTLGVVDFTFEVTDVDHDTWLEEKKQAILATDGPALFLMRAGSVCGPRFSLDPDAENVLGRSFPRPHELPSKRWDDSPQPDWNLSGLAEHEKKFVGFRHVSLTHDGDGWNVQPLTKRQRTYVNRVEISGETPLMPGDELALGSVVLHFHDPMDLDASTQSRTAELPAVVNWREEHTSPRVIPLAPDSELSDATTGTGAGGEEDLDD